MQCIDNYNNTVNHGHTHVIIRMGTMHKHSTLLFPVVIVFVCEILTAPVNKSVTGTTHKNNNDN